MKKFTRIITFLLAVSMCFSMVGCGDLLEGFLESYGEMTLPGTLPNDQSGGNPLGEATKTPEGEETLPGGEYTAEESNGLETVPPWGPGTENIGGDDPIIPPDMNLGVEMNILAGELYSYEWLFEDYGGPIDSALYGRLRRIEEKLNIKLYITMLNGSPANKAEFIETVRAWNEIGEDVDLISGYSSYMGELTLTGMFQNIDTGHIDYSQPWWPSDLRDNMTIDDRMYTVTGDVSPTFIYELYTVFYNRQIIDAYGLQDPIELVREQRWTLDKLIEMTDGIYEDSDADARVSEGDFFALNFNDLAHIKAFPIGMDVRFMESRHGNSYRLSDALTDGKMLELDEKMDFWFKDPGVKNQSEVGFADYGKSFAEGRCLFNVGSIYYANTELVYSDVDYGILPCPKYDEAQADYVSSFGYPVSFWSIPRDADPYYSSIVLENLAADAYTYITPTIFEYSMNMPYEPESNERAEMFELIRSTATVDPAAVYYGAIASGYKSFTDMVNTDKPWAAIANEMRVVWKASVDKVSTTLRQLESGTVKPNDPVIPETDPSHPGGTVNPGGPFDTIAPDGDGTLYLPPLDNKNPEHTGTHTGNHAEIFPIEKFTPIVDGVRDPQYLFSREVTLRDNGPQFAKGSIYYLWDEDALYFYVYIMDSTPGDPENGISHESDCIEMDFSLYNFDYNADKIVAKQASDIGDAQFRVFRDKVISNCENLVDNGIKYADGSHGGFGKWVYDNTQDKSTSKYTEGDASGIIHDSDETGYWFEGYVKWSPELKKTMIRENLVIGLGIQVNDDINGDCRRDMKCYADNSGPNDWSMATNRATCGKFILVNNGYGEGDLPDVESSVPNPPSAGDDFPACGGTEEIPETAAPEEKPDSPSFDGKYPMHTGTHEGTHAEIFNIEKHTPFMDGVRDPEYTLSREVTLRDNGPEYAQGSIYYLWDDEALYFYVHIMDSTPSDPENGVNHESDCIEMLFSLYNFDYNADNIKAKQASDIGDAHFRVFRDKAISNCENLVDNGIVYGDGSYGGFGKWVFDNTADKTTFKYTEGDASYIIHDSDETGYWFEGFVRWSPDLLNDMDHPLGEGSVIGLGIQVNDDINADNKREKKCYADNSGPNDWSMATNRATCGKFILVDEWH